MVSFVVILLGVLGVVVFFVFFGFFFFGFFFVVFFFWGGGGYFCCCCCCCFLFFFCCFFVVFFCFFWGGGCLIPSSFVLTSMNKLNCCYSFSYDLSCKQFNKIVWMVKGNNWLQRAHGWASNIPITPSTVVRPSTFSNKTSSPPKPLGKLNTHFKWRFLRNGSESLFKWSWSHYQDGRHDHIWQNPLKTFFSIVRRQITLGLRGLPIFYQIMILDWPWDTWRQVQNCFLMHLNGIFLKWTFWKLLTSESLTFDFFRYVANIGFPSLIKTYFFS